MDIIERHTGFRSSGCGEWTADLTPVIERGAPFGAGTFLVGSEVLPGRYYAASPLESCTWALAFDFAGALGWSERGTLPIVDIEPSHAGFASAGCGRWSSDPGPRAQVATTFGDGTFVVGVDVAPGRYRSVSSSDECAWQRLRRFGGEVDGGSDDHIIGWGGGFIPYVDIAPTDAGFVSAGCGTWSTGPRATDHARPVVRAGHAPRGHGGGARTLPGGRAHSRVSVVAVERVRRRVLQ